MLIFLFIVVDIIEESEELAREEEERLKMRIKAVADAKKELAGLRKRGRYSVVKPVVL